MSGWVGHAGQNSTDSIQSDSRESEAMHTTSPSRVQFEVNDSTERKENSKGSIATRNYEGV